MEKEIKQELELSGVGSGAARRNGGATEGVLVDLSFDEKLPPPSDDRQAWWENEDAAVTSGKCLSSLSLTSNPFDETIKVTRKPPPPLPTVGTVGSKPPIVPPRPSSSAMM